MSHNTSYDSANMPRTDGNSDGDFGQDSDQNRLIKMIYANYQERRNIAPDQDEEAQPQTSRDYIIDEVMPEPP